jgi:hypothetical protein
VNETQDVAAIYLLQNAQKTTKDPSQHFSGLRVFERFQQQNAGSPNRTSFSLSIKHGHVPGCPSLTDSEVKRNVDMIHSQIWTSDKKKVCVIVMCAMGSFQFFLVDSSLGGRQNVRRQVRHTCALARNGS